MDEIRVQVGDFSLAAEWQALSARTGADTGAVAAFVGLVREVCGDAASRLELEHYPGMTEQSIAALVAQARQRWRLAATTVIHRVGQLKPRDQIVLVLTAARHRAEALAACTFLIDMLKTEAVIWKRERAQAGAGWVSATDQDAVRADAWRASEGSD